MRLSFLLATGAFIFLLSGSGYAQPLTVMTPHSGGPTNSSGAANSPEEDPARSLIDEAVDLLHDRDVDDALDKLDAGLKVNPRSTVGLVLRATVYGSKKLWPKADADLTAAEQIAPSDVNIKFALAECKLAEKQYDVARVRYTALQDNPDWGDLAAYEVFICNLAGGHEEVARKELDAFNRVGSKPSYYFSNATWSLYHKDIDGGRDWLNSAAHIYPLQKIAAYAQSLHNLGYLPIPLTSSK